MARRHCPSGLPLPDGVSVRHSESARHGRSDTDPPAAPAPRRRPKCWLESVRGDEGVCGASARDVDELVRGREDARTSWVSSVHPPGGIVRGLTVLNSVRSSHAALPKGHASRYQYVSAVWTWPRYVDSLGSSRSTSTPA